MADADGARRAVTTQTVYECDRILRESDRFSFDKLHSPARLHVFCIFSVCHYFRLSLNPECKILGCHVGCRMGTLHGVLLIKKQITESVGKSRDEFIKLN